MGELLKQYDRIPRQEDGKFKEKLPEGITHKQSHYAQTLADHPGPEKRRMGTASEKIKQIKGGIMSKGVKTSNYRDNLAFTDSQLKAYFIMAAIILRRGNYEEQLHLGSTILDLFPEVRDRCNEYAEARGDNKLENVLKGPWK